MSLNVKDRLAFQDKNPGVNMPELRGSGFWARTEVIGGYDLNYNPRGKSTLGECVFNTHNIVPIGGVSFAMESIFGVEEKQIEIPTLYSETGIGIPDSLAPTETYMTPEGPRNVIYRHGHFTQLYGIGITGTAENDVTIYPVDYREKSIDLAKVNTDGMKVTGTMLPFRYTMDNLTSKERRMYFGKKVDAEGYTGYYLKRFETDATIKHVWTTGEEDDDEQLIASSDVWLNASGLNSVQSFTEMILKITKKDVKEWFAKLDQEDRARFNTLALFNGRFIKDENDPADYGEYQDVRMFSKLCINPEYLNLAKDLNIIYRVYGA